MLIATHNGKFHADDVFGVALLLLLFPEARLIRTRDGAKLAEADIVLDVGAVYDPASRRFDHHQKGAPKRSNDITYSAFGLLWKEYGLQYCDGNKELWRRIDEKLIQYIDARDNGNEVYVLNEKNVTPFTISDNVSLFNPLTNSTEDFDSQFMKAVERATTDLDRLKAVIQDQLTNETYFEQQYAQSSDKRFAVLDKYLDIVGIAERHPELLFVVFPEEANAQWMLHTVRVKPSEFKTRKPLPEAWQSLQNEELAEVTGVVDAVFCHAGRFVAAARSKEGTMRLLELALGE